MTRRGLSSLLALALVLSLIPSAFAASQDGRSPGTDNYFYFMSSTGDDAIVVATKVLHSDDGPISDLSDVVVPLDATHGVAGWYADRDCRDEITELTYDAARTAPVPLYPDIKEGYWVTFESNGGTYLPPRFFVGNASEPTSEPNRYGYTFEGWYSDVELTAEANFAAIKEPTVVYAKWTAKNDTKYTVLYWLENANDDDYSYVKSEYRYGTTGEKTNVTAGLSGHEGFGEPEKIEQQTINGDGSTVINVYYKRNVYDVFFYEALEDDQGSLTGEVIERHHIKAKYGADIADKWPGGVWRTTLTNEGIYQAYIKVMPLGGATFYYDTLGSETDHADYYVEKLGGKEDDYDDYVLDHQDYGAPRPEYDDEGKITRYEHIGITDNDCYDIEGFTFKGYLSDPKKTFFDKADKQYYDEYRGASFYYSRNTYHVSYMNQSENPEKEAGYKYQASISDAGGYTPQRPSGVPENHSFIGWYADKECTEPYHFDDKTMPAHNITVYAKWAPPVHTVTFMAYGNEVGRLSVPDGSTCASTPELSSWIHEGDTFFGWTYGNDPFKADTLITEDTVLYAQVSDGKSYTVTYDANGNGTPPIDPYQYARNKLAMVLPAPTGAGATFLGWSTAKDSSGKMYAPGDAISLPQDVTLYAIWRSSHGGGSSRPTLNTKDHFGYIIGYPVDYFTGEPTTDQTKKPVRPQGEITRAEVATIFFRMLTDESRTQYWSQSNDYSDVEQGQWFNAAVSTLSKAGIISGYPDGSFRPNGSITRAEFATIAVRFFDVQYDGAHLFPDIDGHWAQDHIDQASSAGLVNGYPDGTFGPDRSITRAEAVTLVNRTLDRHPDPEHFLKDMLVWPDNMDTTAWYYADMQEATNSHQYEMKTDSDKTKHEVWTKMLPIRDWEAFEKAWSDAGSASNPGEVVNK